jgi:CIC family chloride channel protein
VGFVIAGFERVTDELLLERVLRAPLWQQLLAPTAGLLITAAGLRFLGGGATPATADEYIGNFHDRRRVLPLRPWPARLVGGAATVGLGGSMGLEGPSIYTGAVLGSALQQRLKGAFTRDDAKLLLVAGAAAGVAAIFKTPATGVMFALEVPYQDDVARRALIPALIASASSYLVFVTLVGSTVPIFPVFGSVPDFELAELGGAALVGLAAGLGARGFSWGVLQAKAIAEGLPLLVRVATAGAVLAGVTGLSQLAFDLPLTLGPGYDVLAWIRDPNVGLELVALLFVLRAVATIATLGGGGAGGLFIPLGVLGLLLGRFVGGVLDEPSAALFPFIGLAAFLGAGYRTPIAAVMFVAESTGRAGFVVPALIAAAVSQLVMGRWSVSTRQQSVRAGHLERRFLLPVTSALTTDVLTVPPDATMSEFVYVHVLGHRERSVPVVADGRYLGMCDLEAISEVPREHWDTTTVEPLVRRQHPVGGPAWTLRDALVAMDEADVDRLPLADAQGGFIGIVELAEILKLDEILDETSGT